MPENVTVNAPVYSGGAEIRTEQIGGAQYQVIKLAIGATDQFESDVSTTTPLPTGYAAAAPVLTRQPINVSSLGQNTVIAGESNKVISVYRLFWTCADAVDITIENGSTALTGPLSAQTLALDFDSEPYFVCGSGEPFNFFLTAGVQVSGAVYFTQH